MATALWHGDRKGRHYYTTLVYIVSVYS